MRRKSVVSVSAVIYERLYAVPLGEHETVAPRCFGAAGVQALHDVEVEGRHQIEARQVAADVSGLGAVDHLDQPLAVALGQECQFVCCHKLM